MIFNFEMESTYLGNSSDILIIICVGKTYLNRIQHAAKHHAELLATLTWTQK